MFGTILKSVEFKNFSYITISNFISQIIGLLVVIKIANIFLPSDYGVFTFMLAQCQMIMSISDLGIRNILIRKIARKPELGKKLVIVGFILKFLAIIITCILYYLYNELIGNLNPTHLLLIFLLAFLNCLNNLFESIFWGYQDMIYTSCLNIFWSLTWFFVVNFSSQSAINITYLFKVLIIITSIKVLLYTIVISYQNRITNRLNFKITKYSKNLLSESWPYLSLTLLLLPITYFSNNFLDINSSNEQLGYFNLVNKLMIPFLVIVNIGLTSLFPNLSVLFIKENLIFKYKIKKNLIIFFLLMLTIVVIFTNFSFELVHLFFNPKYSSILKIAQLQVWYVFFMAINTFIGTVWGAANMEKLIFKTAFINMIIATPLLYMGSFYGAIGLSCAYVISFAIFEIYLWNKFLKSFKIHIPNEFTMWISAILLFVMCYFYISNLSLYLRCIFTLMFLVVIILYTRQKIFIDEKR